MKILFFKNQFFANFSKQIIFFYAKFAFRMFPAFIWCTYCPCKSKIMNFQKLSYRKLENFRGQTRLLQRHLAEKLQKIGWFSKTLEVYKDASSHLRPFGDDLNGNWHYRSKKTKGGLNQLGFCAPVLPISIQIIHKWSQMRAGIFIPL